MRYVIQTRILVDPVEIDTVSNFDFNQIDIVHISFHSSRQINNPFFVANNCRNEENVFLHDMLTFKTSKLICTNAFKF